MQVLLTCLRSSESGWPMPPAAPSTETLACLGAETLKFLLPTFKKLQAARLTKLAIATPEHLSVKNVILCCARRQKSIH